MTRFHLLQLSDLHLSRARPYNVANWEAWLRHIETLRPDLVVLTGDHQLDDPDDADDRAFVAEQLGRLTVPWRLVPGNHDVGDSLFEPYLDQPITEARRQGWRATFGDDWWSTDLGAWRLIGINAQLLDSGLAAEIEQARWLAACAADAGARPIALFLHKPLCLDRFDETELSRSVLTPAARAAVLGPLAGAPLRLVAAGHTHRFRSLTVGGVAMVWAPTTSQLNRNFHVPRGGDTAYGGVLYALDRDGVEWRHVEAPGSVPADLTEVMARYKAPRFAPAHA